MEEAKLGDLAKDTITGFEGTVIAITEWLHACKRVTLQPRELNSKTGQPIESNTFDMPQLQVLIPIKEVRKIIKTGGPSIPPRRATDPI